MRLSHLTLAALLPLAACATSPAFDTETAVDSANIAATEYLGLPLCGGAQTLCRSPDVVPKVIAATRALNADWATYSAPGASVTLAAIQADVAAVNALTKKGN